MKGSNVVAQSCYPKLAGNNVNIPDTELGLQVSRNVVSRPKVIDPFSSAEAKLGWERAVQGIAQGRCREQFLILQKGRRLWILASALCPKQNRMMDCSTCDGCDFGSNVMPVLELSNDQKCPGVQGLDQQPAVVSSEYWRRLPYRAYYRMTKVRVTWRPTWRAATNCQKCMCKAVSPAATAQRVVQGIKPTQVHRNQASELLLRSQALVYQKSHLQVLQSPQIPRRSSRLGLSRVKRQRSNSFTY